MRKAIAVAMERMRWLDRNPPATRIDVNLASARLAYWRDDKLNAFSASAAPRVARATGGTGIASSVRPCFSRLGVG